MASTAKGRGRVEDYDGERNKLMGGRNGGNMTVMNNTVRLRLKKKIKIFRKKNSRFLEKLSRE